MNSFFDIEQNAAGFVRLFADGRESPLRYIRADTPFSLRLRLRGKGQITLRGLVRTIAPAKGKLWEEDASWQA